MLKSRLIPCIICKGDLVVQSFGFNKYLPIGNVKTAIEFFVNWDVDEIVVIDIDATKEGREPNFALVEWAARECFVPLTVGGGVKTVQHIKDLLKTGADKVCLNAFARKNPEFVTEAAEIFGSQCVTVSIDAIHTPEGYRVYDHIKQQPVDVTPSEQAKAFEALGAGEIFLNSVDRDGCREGYDVELLSSVSDQLKIPVIACGGVGRFSHLSEAIQAGGCQAAAAANIFQHSEHSTIAAKAHLLRSGVDVRLMSAVRYDDFEFDITGRPY